MIQILICDDHPLIRTGVRRILEYSGILFTLTETSSAEETMGLLHQKNNKFHLLILDITLPGQDGLSLIKDIKALRPEMHVLMLSMHDEKSMILDSFKNGASGYLTKDVVFEDLLTAINQIMDGGKYLMPSLNQLLVNEISKNNLEFPHELLSKNEFSIMLKLVLGKKTGEIAGELNKNPNTISTYKKRILTKMNMQTLPELYSYCATHKLL